MAKDKFDKRWILDTGIPIIESYGGNLTLRALHYRLVAEGMTNDIQHYKRVVSTMTVARWNGEIHFESFVDHERESIGETKFQSTDVDQKADEAKHQIKLWATSYRKNRWENQPIYPEIFIEKKALQGVFQDPCYKFDVALNPCKGYPSLSFLYEAKKRFSDAIAEGKEPIILYFGDYDCSGEDIPRSIQESLSKMGVDVEVRRIALMEEQVIKWKLPPAPTKSTDSRSSNWDGLGQVELDAVEPRKIVKLCTDALDSIFDQTLYKKLIKQEEEEREIFQQDLRDNFDSLLED